MTRQRPELLRAAEAAGAPAREPAYLRGVLLVMLAGGFWSLGGLLVRLVEVAGAWQILFYRSAALAVTIFCILLLSYRGAVFARIRAAGWPAAAGGLCLSFGFTGWIFALLNTTVANGVFMLSAAPLAAALLARVILKEPVHRATWLAMVAAVVGVGVMVAGGIGAGRLFGNFMAMLAMLGFSGFAVALRWGRGGDMLPAVLWAGVFAAVVAASQAGDLAITGRDLSICISMGTLQIGLGLVCFTRGSRVVPAAELALLSLTEVVLAPVWVWLALAEVPSASTLVGGAIVLAAVAGRALAGLRRRPPPIGAM